MKRSRRWPWLIAAVLLFAGAAYFMSQGDTPEKAPAVEKVNFPTRLNSDEFQRLERRRTLRPEVAKALAGAAQPKPAKARDPLLVALPAKGKTAVVFEANALRNSPVGELLLDCMRTKTHAENPFDQVQQHTGINPLTDIDRVAMTGDGIIVSGNFQNANWDQLAKNSGTQSSYGDHATIFTPPAGVKPKSGTMALAVWNNQMVISGSSVASLQQTIDRLEGRSPPEPPALDDEDSYGEVYGVISPADLADMLGPDQKALGEKIQEAAQQVKLHVDAESDVAMVADLSGDDADKVTDLGKTLGGVLSLGRLKAQADNEKDLADLLDLAKVRPEGDHFRAELALPMSFLQQKLAWCRDHLDGGGAAVPASAGSTGAAEVPADPGGSGSAPPTPAPAPSP